MDSSSPAPPADDALLLRCFVREGSESAFRALAERHLPLVWSVAQRVVNGDAALAEDVAQTVLADFARKAPSLPPGTVAAAWLHRHTVFTASKAVRSEIRRRKREQLSVANFTADSADVMNVTSANWTDLAPHIDTALDKLSGADRSAVILRYYEKRPLREVGRAIGISEEAARKRIDRALTKLRSHLKRRGAAPAAALLISLIHEQSTAASSPSSFKRILSGASHRLEEGILPAYAGFPRWRRRLAPVASILILAGGLIWLFSHSGSSAVENPPGTRIPAHPLNSASIPSPTAPAASPTLTATLLTLPEEPSLTARMLLYQPGRDDADLYHELLPKAALLQKQVNADRTLATTGYPVVILSGQAKLKPAPRQAAKSPAVMKTPFLEDPFAADEGNEGVSQNPFGIPQWIETPPSLRLAREASVASQNGWTLHQGSGHISADDNTSRYSGSTLTADISVPGADSLYAIKCTVDHCFAPEVEDWPYAGPNGKDDTGDKTASIAPLRVHSVHLSGKIAAALSGPPVLAAMTMAASDGLSEENRRPRRVFLFLNLAP